MLSAIVRRLSLGMGTVIVVASGERRLPELPATCRVVVDSQSHRGPLFGLHDALQPLAEDIEPLRGWFYLTGCDMPLADAAFARALVARGDDRFEGVVPCEGERLQPLAAVYRPSIRTALAREIAAGETRLTRFVERLPVLAVDVRELQRDGISLDPLLGVNTPAELLEARRRYDGDDTTRGRNRSRGI